MTAPRPIDDIRRTTELMMAMVDDGNAEIRPTDPDDGVGVAWIRVMDAAAVAASRLAAVERERDEARRVGRLDGQEANNLLVWAEGAEERVNAALARAVAAEARLAAVQKLHVDEELDLIDGETCCRECGVGLPCPTLRALAAPSPQAATKEWRPTMSCCRSASEHELHRPSPQAEPATSPPSGWLGL